MAPQPSTPRPRRNPEKRPAIFPLLETLKNLLFNGLVGVAFFGLTQTA
jgi:hypothetical protein